MVVNPRKLNDLVENIHVKQFGLYLLSVKYLHFSIYSIIFFTKVEQKKMRTSDILIMIFSETVDLIMDWTFYAKLQQESLTGVSENTINWIYGIAVWATVIYICTLLSLVVDCFSDEEHENCCTSALSLLSTVSEDLPQTVCAIMVSWSTSHLISRVQIVKALYGIIEPCLRARNISTKIEKRVYGRNSVVELMKVCDMACSVLCVGGAILFVIILMSK